MPNHGTRGRLVWELLDDVYRRQLAGLPITKMQDEGIMSPTNYYQLRADRMMPRFDVACYLALCFFSVMVGREERRDTALQARYRRWKSWDIVLELTRAFALDFSRRCGNHDYPVAPTVPLSTKFRRPTAAQLEKNLKEHDQAGAAKAGLILQAAVGQAIRFGD